MKTALALKQNFIRFWRLSIKKDFQMKKFVRSGVTIQQNGSELFNNQTALFFKQFYTKGSF